MFKNLLKFITFSLIITIIFTTFSVSLSAIAAEATPVSTKEEFYNIRNNLNGNYYLTTDIVFTASDFSASGTYYNSGKGFLPIGDGKNPFTGTFDGKGFTVSGITVKVSGKVYSISVTPISTGVSTANDDGWTGDYIIPTNPTPTVSPVAGIFGSNKGIIKNVNISDCEISATSSNSATLYVGGITGHNNGTISNCSVKNMLNCNSRTYIGGIAGYQSGGIIKDCFVRGKIESDGTYGGIVGAVAGGSVLNCYSSADFTGTAAAAVKTVGIDVLNNINNCYYISDSECLGVGENIISVKAKKPAFYQNFDFTNTWYMSGTLRTPALKGLNITEGSDITTGDLNADEKLNLLDLIALAQCAANWDISIHKEVANVNFDFTEYGEDIVNLDDVSYLAQYLAGWKEAVIY